MVNDTSRFETLVETLNEWGVNTEGKGYREAVIAYRDFAKQKLSDKDFKVLFGDYGILAADYDLLLDSELEEARKQLNAAKKTYKGLKINIRAMAALGYKGKTMATVAEPNRVLFELTNIDETGALEIAAKLSDLLGMELLILSK